METLTKKGMWSKILSIVLVLTMIISAVPPNGVLKASADTPSPTAQIENLSVSPSTIIPGFSTSGTATAVYTTGDFEPYATINWSLTASVGSLTGVTFEGGATTLSSIADDTGVATVTINTTSSAEPGAIIQLVAAVDGGSGNAVPFYIVSDATNDQPYQILYHSNDGDNYVNSVGGIASWPYTLLTPEQVSFGEDGQTFVEWNTQADGSGTSFGAGDPLDYSTIQTLDTDSDGVVDLYAIWSTIDSASPSPLLQTISYSGDLNVGTTLNHNSFTYTTSNGVTPTINDSSLEFYVDSVYVAEDIYTIQAADVGLMITVDIIDYNGTWQDSAETTIGPVTDNEVIATPLPPTATPAPILTTQTPPPVQIGTATPPPTQTPTPPTATPAPILTQTPSPIPSIKPSTPTPVPPTPSPFVLNYNANTTYGGLSGSYTQSFIPTVNVINNVLTLAATGITGQPGYTFVGWSANPNSTTAEYGKGGNTINDADFTNGMTLYAIWAPGATATPTVPPTVSPIATPIPTQAVTPTPLWDFWLTLDANDGSGRATTISLNNSNPWPYIVPSGFSGTVNMVFEYWNTKADGTGINFVPGNIINGANDLAGSTTLYAIWAPIQTPPPMLPTPSPTPSPIIAPMFTDIQGHWAQAYIEECAQLGFINGRDDGTFDPNASITRAEFVAICNRAFPGAVAGQNVAVVDKKGNSTVLGIIASTFGLAGFFSSGQLSALVNLATGVIIGSFFGDVPPNAWYTQDIAVAVAAGLINGRSQNEFDPDTPITREEAASVLYNYLVAIGYHFPIDHSRGNVFNDQSQIDSWAITAVLQLNSAGILMGNEDGSFHPLNDLTRAEACVITMRAYDGAPVPTAVPTTPTLTPSPATTLLPHPLTNSQPDISIDRAAGGAAFTQFIATNNTMYPVEFSVDTTFIAQDKSNESVLETILKTALWVEFGNAANGVFGNTPPAYGIIPSYGSVQLPDITYYFRYAQVANYEAGNTVKAVTFPITPTPTPTAVPTPTLLPHPLTNTMPNISVDRATAGAAFTQCIVTNNNATYPVEYSADSTFSNSAKLFLGATVSTSAGGIIPPNGNVQLPDQTYYFRYAQVANYASANAVNMITFPNPSPGPTPAP